MPRRSTSRRAGRGVAVRLENPVIARIAFRLRLYRQRSPPLRLRIRDNELRDARRHAEAGPASRPARGCAPVPVLAPLAGWIAAAHFQRPRQDRVAPVRGRGPHLRWRDAAFPLNYRPFRALSAFALAG